ncbi:hypothetical protein MAPG_01921 [Magnaporthiopsis poae ATCC 64411]|uniref:Uncharacterized protein n=1 Tax=Magnaporthiopsis poae (strain ATCC 64411 / 73-15) TaxID=644358 RepID=A0A0C4DPZ0_MAGP6|nr:hypothetical protein MAPG_01921 [Magnaporthiopsis poae ATCC 64411]
MPQHSLPRRAMLGSSIEESQPYAMVVDDADWPRVAGVAGRVERFSRIQRAVIKQNLTTGYLRPQGNVPVPARFGAGPHFERREATGGQGTLNRQVGILPIWTAWAWTWTPASCCSTRGSKRTSVVSAKVYPRAGSKWLAMAQPPQVNRAVPWVPADGSIFAEIVGSQIDPSQLSTTAAPRNGSGNDEMHLFSSHRARPTSPRRWPPTTHRHLVNFCTEAAGSFQTYNAFLCLLFSQPKIIFSIPHPPPRSYNLHPPRQSRDISPAAPSPPIQNQPDSDNMKSITVGTILCAISAISVVAERGLSCGYHLVNSGDWTQSDLAQADCGRKDTCNGKEWNVLFKVVRGPEGRDVTPIWLESTHVFCHKGCWGELNNAQCH